MIENEFRPEKQYEDAGFVNGQTILNSQEKGIELEGPTSGRSQSFESYEDKERTFDAGDFKTNIDEQTNELIVTACPYNQVPKNQKRSKKTGKIIVHFNQNICKKCPYKHRCSVKIGKCVATFTVDKAQYVGAVRHHKYMSNKQYRKEWQSVPASRLRFRN